jgi:hypothetical protein
MKEEGEEKKTKKQNRYSEKGKKEKGERERERNRLEREKKKKHRSNVLSSVPPKTKPYVDVGRSKPSLPFSTESLEGSLFVYSSECRYKDWPI